MLGLAHLQILADELVDKPGVQVVPRERPLHRVLCRGRGGRRELERTGGRGTELRGLSRWSGRDSGAVGGDEGAKRQIH